MKARRIADLVSGALMTGGGGSVLAGWILRIPVLVALSPSFSVTQFNTAFCFVLLGIGMAATGWRGGWLTRAMAALIFAGGAFTLCEYLFHISSSLEAWSGYYAPGAAHPGRMAEDAAIAITALAAAMFFSANGRRLDGWKAALVASLGSIPAAVGFGAILGFVAGFQSVNGWVGFTLVGPPTAILSVVAGANILWRCITGQSSPWIPIPIGMGLLSLLLVLTQAAERNEEAHIKTLSQSTAQDLAESTQSRLAELLTAMDRMAGRWDAAGGTAEPLWENDATAYLHGYPALQGIALLDGAGHVYDDLPRPNDPALIEKLMREVPARARALQAARRTGKAQLTAPLKLARGGWGVLYVVPLRAHGQDDGLMIASVRISSIFAAALDHAMLGQFEISARQGNYTIFATPGAPREAQRTTGVVRAGMRDSGWMISVTPNTNALAERQTLPNLFLGIGLLVTVLITLSSFLALRWRANMLTVQRHEAALARSEETFRATMESAPVGMALLTPQGKRLGCNRALCEMTGYSDEELMLLQPQQLFPDYYDADRAQLNRLVSGEIDNYQMEQVFLTVAGKPLWVQVNASVARGADGSPRHVIKQILDINERKEMDRIKSEFISVVSHELRTPLTAIRGAMGLLSATMSETLPEKSRHLVTIAHRNCERLIALVNDILDMEKLAANRMVFDLKPQGLVALARQVIEAAAPYGQKFGVEFELGTPDGEMTVLADAGRLGQVLTNLLSNAAKFSHEHGKVDIVIRNVDGRAHIDVRDYGVGMSEEFKSRIFGRFMQADSSVSRAKGGTGLGLHISKELTEGMGGTIGFQSVAGQGTDFWIEFPLADIASEHLESIAV